MKTLRTDQAQAIDNVRSAMRETRRVVLQSPCGWGKTMLEALSECVRAINRFPYEGANSTSSAGV